MENVEVIQKPNGRNADKKGMGCLSVFGLMLLTILISVAVTVWFINWYLFPKRFEPVELSVGEQQVLSQKLQRFEAFGLGGSDSDNSERADTNVAENSDALTPIPYSEEGADRTLKLSEREVNAILARNTDLADKLAIDLADDLISARLRLPMDPDFPFFGGKLLKARAGVELRYENDKAVVVLKGISVMGVPIPNAWLGGLKNIDLVEEFGATQGFWKAFSEGVTNVRVVEGDLQIELAE